MAHRIRLAGPWEVTLLPIAPSMDDSPTLQESTRQRLPPHGTLKLPGDWSQLLGSDACGIVQLVRHFGCPTNLAGQRVRLVVEHVPNRAAISLNDQSLGIAEQFPATFDVTGRLSPRNVLAILVHTGGGSRCGAAFLEIDDENDNAAAE